MGGTGRVIVESGVELPDAGWDWETRTIPEAWPYLGPTWLRATEAALTDAKPLHTSARRHADELGPCTFEFTTRVDHLLQYTDMFEHLVDLGLVRVTSALEFPSDRILRIFDKGITVDDMRAAIAEADRMGFELNPTFIPFTPWVGYEELLTFEDFLIETGLARVVDPTALQTRLLLFKGSPLLSSPWVDGLRTVDRGFFLEWTHPDPRVEELWQERRSDAEDMGKIRCCVKC